MVLVMNVDNYAVIVAVVGIADLPIIRPEVTIAITSPAPVHVILALNGHGAVGVGASAPYHTVAYPGMSIAIPKAKETLATGAAKHGWPAGTQVVVDAVVDVAIVKVSRTVPKLRAFQGIFNVGHIG